MGDRARGADAVADGRPVPAPRTGRPGRPATPSIADDAGCHHRRRHRRRRCRRPGARRASSRRGRPDGPFARCPTDPDGGWEIRTRKPPSVADAATARPQAPHLVGVGVRPRPARPRRHAHLLRRRDGGQRRRPDAGGRRRRPPPPPRRRASIGPTASYRLDIRLQGDDESVFFATIWTERTVRVPRRPRPDRRRRRRPTAWLQAMLDAEAALADAQADVGEHPARRGRRHRRGVPRRAVRRRRRARRRRARRQRRHPAGRRGSASCVGPDAAPCTSTATRRARTSSTRRRAVGRRRSAELVGDRPAARRRTLVRRLGDEHGAQPDDRPHARASTPSRRRSATVTARWRDGLDEATATVGRRAPGAAGPARRPVGDGTVVRRPTPAIAAAFARRLGLVDRAAFAGTPSAAPIAAHRRRLGRWPRPRWARSRLDIVLLAQSDVGELAERAEGAGGSSSMAHKHNPIAAISARAAAMQVPGLVSTLLHAAGRPRVRTGRRRLARRVAGAEPAAAGDGLGGRLAARRASSGSSSTPSGWPPTWPRAGAERTP